MSAESGQTSRLPDRIRRFFHSLGPGVVTGAADDDPSGISTYSVAGATFGLTQLWTVFLTFPLMASVQIMCARLGLVTGEGFAGVLRRHYPRGVLFFACSLLVVANIVNIGADLSGMAEALEMVTGLNRWFWLPFVSVGILLAVVYWNYRHLAAIFKWLTLVLFTYVVAAFLAKPDWLQVLRATFVPHLEMNSRYLIALVAILGTTITPYMFFWQAAQEVEEEKAKGMRTIRQRKAAGAGELRAAHVDVLTGMGWAGVAMYFIILTTAVTLHPAGHNVETAQQAAEALRPLAGNAAYLLFALGLVGTGMLAVPVLAGSAAYAITEAMHWRGSLDDKPHVGRKFYFVVIAAVLLGLGLDAFGVSAVKALYYAAIVNGVLAPPLVVMVTMLTSNKNVMGAHTSPPIIRWLGWTTAAVMSVAAIAMFVSL